MEVRENRVRVFYGIEKREGERLGSRRQKHSGAGQLSPCQVPRAKSLAELAVSTRRQGLRSRRQIGGENSV